MEGAQFFAEQADQLSALWRGNGTPCAEGFIGLGDDLSASSLLWC
ncbi:hypothetical protein VXQ18_03655 [Brucella abortus]|nr:hypothetical protein [Brucella abortus]